MKKLKPLNLLPVFFCFIFGLVLTFASVTLANAPSPPSSDRNRPFGLGVLFGEPTGISGKYWLSPRNAIDGAAAWSFGNDDSFHLHFTYLWHELKLIRVQTAAFDLFYGVGGRVVFNDDPRVGVRIPVGLAYRFSDPPVEIFFELAPILDLAPRTDVDFNGGIGARFYF